MTVSLEPRGLAIAAALLVTGTSVLALALDRPYPRPDARADALRLEGRCDPVPPTFSGSAVSVGDRWTALYTNGYARLRVCQPGRLKLSTRGSEAAGAASLATITVGTELVWQGEVSGDQRTIEVDLPVAGWVVVGFHNDRVAGEDDRNLWLADIAFDPR